MSTRIKAPSLSPLFPQFVHRHNANGMIDSICCSCFATVATDSSEMALYLAEARHICPMLASER